MSMTNEDLQRLMLDVLDGTASREEENLLASRLEMDPVLRQQFEDARMAGSAIEGVGFAELPRGLRDEIRATVRPERRRPVQEAGRHPDWRGLFADRPLISLASAFATGAAAGILLFALLTGQGPIGGAAPPPIQGVMRPMGESPAATAISRADLGDVTVALWGEGQDLTLRIESKTPDRAAAPVEIDFDPTTIEPTSTRWRAGMESRIEIAAGRITIAPHGPASCELGMRIGNGRAADMRIGPSAEGGPRRLVLIAAE